MRSVEYLKQYVVPNGIETKDLKTYVPDENMGHAGIDMRVEEQIETLKRWKRTYSEFFKALRDDPNINTLCPGEGHIHNNFYPTPDAEIYAAMILDKKPENIVEVGSGFSTIVARKAVEELGNECRITVVDPEPRTNVTSCVDKIYRCLVEDIEPGSIPTGGETILFIDSSHVAKSRGDIPYLFNRLIPTMSPGAVVHVHDIFIPYDYSYMYQDRLYTEQYVLQALLCNSGSYRVLMANHFMARTYPEVMQQTISEIVGKDDLYYGASFWFGIE